MLTLWLIFGAPDGIGWSSIYEKALNASKTESYNLRICIWCRKKAFLILLVRGRGWVYFIAWAITSMVTANSCTILRKSINVTRHFFVFLLSLGYFLVNCLFFNSVWSPCDSNIIQLPHVPILIFTLFRKLLHFSNQARGSDELTKTSVKKFTSRLYAKNDTEF